ncbi:rhomboid domain-containing protein 3 [Elgaria multicarinata webbii]|uniref:rhomboid domain-containing protein 3 n=1 Tax=Elgaria multicarinata webbii TaxID=159646 RepID=UPI002FCD32B8
MLFRRLLSGPWGARRPPMASSTLMLLLCLFWLTGVGDSMALVPDLLTSPFQAYRLVTYCLGPADAALLVLNLLFFPPLAWRQELQQGTLRYLHASVIGAVAPALLYLLLAGWWGAPPGAAVGGYTPVHLALLGCHLRQKGPSGRVSAALLAGLLLGLSQALSPRSPFLLHVCGLLTGLAYWAGIFSPLELSERRLERLHSGIIHKAQARGSFLPFVMPPAAAILPTTDPAAGRERAPLPLEFHAPGLYPGGFPTPPPISPSPFYGSGESPGLEQAPWLSLASGSLPSSSTRHGASDIPFLAPRESLTDEELLQAGIRASLHDLPEEEMKLSKSSVSSLRLQQLQKMGFPTERAVVALAATGHVEGAVSLLIGGHVGDEVVVTAEGRLGHPK